MARKEPWPNWVVWLSEKGAHGQAYDFPENKLAVATDYFHLFPKREGSKCILYRALGLVLICSGCHNKIPQTGLNNRNLFSYTSGG